MVTEKEGGKYERLKYKQIKQNMKEKYHKRTDNIWFPFTVLLFLLLYLYRLFFFNRYLNLKASNIKVTEKRETKSSN